MSIRSPQHHTGGYVARAAALLAALLLNNGLRAGAAVTFDNSANVNLALMRGARLTASANALSDAQAILHPVYGSELRFNSNYGPASLMLELPRVFRINKVRLGFNGVIKSVGLTIKTSSRPLTGDEWKQQNPVWQFTGTTTSATDGWSQAFCEASFAPVPARFVRVEFSGHNGGQAGGAGAGHAQMIVSKIQAYCSDRVVITPEFSSAQAASAGSIASLDELAQGAVVLPGLNDDSDAGVAGFGGLLSSFATNPSRDDGKLLKPPARFIVTLRHRADVEAVAYSAIAPPREERPRDLQIYTSAYEIGENWVLRKSLKDIRGGAYEEIAFDQPVRAKRVRFDVPRVWNHSESGGTAPGYMGELYVYGTALPADFGFTLARDAINTATVYNANGQRVRNLWSLRAMKAGSYSEEWDGLSDAFAPAPPGDYEVRLLTNTGRAENVAILGNTGRPPDNVGHMPVSVGSVAADENGAIYTANNWDEGGHDWKKWDAAGTPVANANFGVRNGDPNSLPYRITTDDKYLYIACQAVGGAENGGQWIQRWTRDGQYTPWPKLEKGKIKVYPATKETTGTQPITSMAVAGGLIFAGDARGHRVLKYDRETGQQVGEFAFANPGPLAAGDKQLWIVQHDSSIVVADFDGKVAATPINGCKKISGLSLRGNRLIIADAGANQIRVYKVSETTATPEKTFGTPALPGDVSPDHFYALLYVAATPDGGCVSVQHIGFGGDRMTKWTRDWKMQWEQLGLEFTGNANYATAAPDEVFSSFFHRYDVDKNSGAWKYGGNYFSGGNTGMNYWQGAPRWVKLGDQWFFFITNGDGVQAYRRVGKTLRMASLIGGQTPLPDNTIGTKLPQWSWSDLNQDGKVQEAEISWFKQPGEGRYAVEGMNTDTRGNIIYCDEGTRAIMLLPMVGLDKAGNPTYDWAKLKQLVAADDSPSKFLPLMAVRSEHQQIYAFGRSDLFQPFGGAGPAWMGGWTLAKFDKNGKRLWIIRLPQHVTGMDIVPGRAAGDFDNGVMVGHFASAEIFHISPEGEVLRSVKPGKAAGFVSGWLDNTGSVAVNRDPRDGLLDIFAEEGFAHRVLWYRVDDSQLAVQKVPLHRD